MKKIIILGCLLFLVACATGQELIKENKIRIGMSKADVNFVLAFQADTASGIFLPLSYREYFNKEKKEILSGESNKNIYYVFKNVYKKVTCGWIMCNEGSGVLDKIFYNYHEARQYVFGNDTNLVKKEPKKTITIVEDNKETQIVAEDNTIEQLNELIEKYKSGEISEEEFSTEKKKILE